MQVNTQSGLFINSKLANSVLTSVLNILGQKEKL